MESSQKDSLLLGIPCKGEIEETAWTIEQLSCVLIHFYLGFVSVHKVFCRLQLYLDRHGLLYLLLSLLIRVAPNVRKDFGEVIDQVWPSDASRILQKRELELIKGARIKRRLSKFVIPSWLVVPKRLHCEVLVTLLVVEKLDDCICFVFDARIDLSP